MTLPQLPQTQPALVVAPGTETDLAKFITAQHKAGRLLRNPPEETTFWNHVLPAIAKPVAATTVAGLATLGTLAFDAPYVTALMELSSGFGLMTVLGLGALGWDNWERERLLRRQHIAAAGRYVAPEQLTDVAGALLSRAQRAIGVIRSSRVNSDDVIDRTRNDVVLPDQLWEIADSLREYSRIVGDDPEPQNLRERLLRKVTGNDPRTAALIESRSGIERRVAALEAYAAEARKADQQYLQWLQLAQREEDAVALLELLARTAADDWAVAQVSGMTAQATSVARKLQEAVAAAREAGARVLLPGDQAA